MTVMHKDKKSEENTFGGGSMSKYKNKRPPKRLKQYRLEKGYSLNSLSKKLNVEPTTISYWEHGGRFPRQDKLREIEDFFDKSYRDLFEDLTGEEIVNLEELEEEFISNH